MKQAKIPLSPKAASEMFQNGALLALLVFLCILGASILHYRLDDVLYERLYPISYPTAETARANLADPNRGVRGDLVGIDEAHFLAHNGSYVYGDRGYGEREGGAWVPAPERVFFAIELCLFWAIFSFTPLGVASFIARRNKCLADNSQDWDWMERLINGVFSVEDPFSIEQGVAEPVADGGWVPVEKDFVYSTRTDYDEYGRRSFSASDFTQVGGLIWFRSKETGEMLRVVISNQGQVRRFVADAVEKWFGHDQYGYREPYTHVERAIASYRFTADAPRPTPALNEVVVDLQNPSVGGRRSFKLNGVRQGDLLLATSLSLVDGSAAQTVLPTGYLQRVLGEIAIITGKELPAPNPSALIAA